MTGRNIRNNYNENEKANQNLRGESDYQFGCEIYNTLPHFDISTHNRFVTRDAILKTCTITGELASNIACPIGKSN